MNHKSITITSIILATVMLVSLFAVVSSAASVSGQARGTTTPTVGGVLAGTGPGVSNMWKNYENDVFAVDTSGTLWYRSIYSDGTWASLGGVCTASPAAVSWDGNNRMDVFVRGSDSHLWQTYSNDGGYTWSSWKSPGGLLASGTGPAVYSSSAGHLDVFVEGTNGVLYQISYAGSSWSGWHSLGGKLTASPAASYDSSGRTYVFVRGTDGAVWQKTYYKGWSGWKGLGGKVAPNTGPAVNYYASRLFVQGTDHKLYRMDFSSTGPSTSWLGTGKPSEKLSASSPACSNVVANDHTVVCVSTTTGNIWWSADSLGNWNSWYSVGSP